MENSVHFKVGSVKRLLVKVRQYKALFEVDPAIAVCGVFSSDGELAFLTNKFYEVKEIGPTWLIIDAGESGILRAKPSEPFFDVRLTTGG